MQVPLDIGDAINVYDKTFILDRFEISREGTPRVTFVTLEELKTGRVTSGDEHVLSVGFTDETMVKVHEALHRAGLIKEDRLNAIAELEKSGILFRERVK